MTDVMRTRRWREALAIGLLVMIGLFAVVADAGAGAAGGVGRIDAGITRIMSQAQYRHGRWGMLVLDPRRGSRTQAINSDELFVPGSATKLFSISAAWNTLGPGHRFTTPVYALGPRRGNVLDGNLVLVASGDLTLGGRTTRNGSVAFTNVDHGDANSVPGATLTPRTRSRVWTGSPRRSAGRGLPRFRATSPSTTACSPPTPC